MSVLKLDGCPVLVFLDTLFSAGREGSCVSAITDVAERWTEDVIDRARLLSWRATHARTSAGERYSRSGALSRVDTGRRAHVCVRYHSAYVFWSSLILCHCWPECGCMSNLSSLCLQSSLCWHFSSQIDDRMALLAERHGFLRCFS